MDNLENETYLDKQEKNNQNINGKPITYKTGEVADILNETPAMIRYYCREFEEYLTLDHKPGEHRSYHEKNVTELKYIMDLIKNDGLSVKQVHEYLSSPEGKIAAPIFDQQEKMKTLINAMVEKVDDKLQQIVKRELESTFTPMIKEALGNTFKEVANKEDLNNINKNIEKIKEEIFEDNKNTKKALSETALTKEDLKTFEENMEKMVEEKLKSKNEDSKRGFFSRLFSKA